MKKPTATTDRTYRGVRISKTDFGRFLVHAPVAWGDQPGENTYTFKTLARAKEFITNMALQWNLAA